MMNTEDRFDEDKKDSTMNHKIFGFPILKKFLKLKEIHSVEEHLGNDDLKSLLDMFEGSDSIGLGAHGVIGFASRVQWAHPIKGSNDWASKEEEWWPPQYHAFIEKKGYQTFTIRYERESGSPTEFIKRLDSILNDTNYPIYTVQQYLSHRYAYKRKGKGKLLSLGICKTRDLILFIKNGKRKYDYQLKNVNKNGRARFFTISWQHYLDSGNYFKIYPNDLLHKSPQTNLSDFIKTKQEVSN